MIKWNRNVEETKLIYTAERWYNHYILNLPRFDGTAPEPRKGVRSGHIPGSKCVPFPDVSSNTNLNLNLHFDIEMQAYDIFKLDTVLQMLDSGQLFLPWNEIQKKFEKEGEILFTH